MKNIRIEKFITQYEKNKLINTKRVKLEFVPDVETAKNIIKATDLHYVKDITGLSLFESIKATYWDDTNTIKQLFKQYNFDTLEIWENIK